MSRCAAQAGPAGCCGGVARVARVLRRSGRARTHIPRPPRVLLLRPWSVCVEQRVSARDPWAPWLLQRNAWGLPPSRGPASPLEWWLCYVALYSGPTPVTGTPVPQSDSRVRRVGLMSLTSGSGMLLVVWLADSRVWGCDSGVFDAGRQAAGFRARGSAPRRWARRARDRCVSVSGPACDGPAAARGLPQDTGCGPVVRARRLQQQPVAAANCRAARHKASMHLLCAPRVTCPSSRNRYAPPAASLPSCTSSISWYPSRKSGCSCAAGTPQMEAKPRARASASNPSSL